MRSEPEIFLKSDINPRIVSIISRAKLRDYPQSVVSMKELLDLLPNHPSYSLYVLNQVFAAGANKREALKLITLYKKTFPFDPNGYLLNALFYSNTGDIEQIKKTGGRPVTKHLRDFIFSL